MSPFTLIPGDQRKCGPIGMLRSMISMRAPKRLCLPAGLLTLEGKRDGAMGGQMGRVANKTAIITGGAGGIGAATGLLFCEEGARVALVDSDETAMDKVLADIRAKVPGAQVSGMVADVGREDMANVAVAEIRREFGPIDVLVNLAG